MFSTMTTASSTKIPIENIKANNETRLSVKPYAHDANKVTAKVIETAKPTTIASRHPNATKISKTTEAVANINFVISF